MCQEFRTQVVIACSPNRWMNTELNLQWVKNALGAFPFQRRLGVSDSYKCHIEDTFKKLLATKKIDTVIVLCGCTKCGQAPDVSWNKTFKPNCSEKYDDWLAREGINNEMEASNLKVPPREQIVKWIFDAWAALALEIIKNL